VALKTIFYIVCLTIVGTLVSFGPARAFDPQTPAIGARPLGLGKAFAGLADDGSAIFLNPAGLARTGSLKLMSFYATPFPDWSDNVIVALGAALPDVFGRTLGAGYINDSTSGFILNSTEYSLTKQRFLLGFAENLDEKLALGINLNVMTIGASIQSPLLAGTVGSGLDLDAGLLYKMREGLTLGANLQNVLPSSLGGKFTYDSGASESLPANLKAGLSWKFRGGYNLLFDLDYSLEKIRPVLLHLGLEFLPNGLIALRGGLDQSPQTPDTRTDVYTHTTLGLGINLRGYTFDYTYYKHGNSSGDVTNYFSMGYVGPAPAKPQPTREAAPVPVVPPSELAPPRVEISHFKDVPANYPSKEAIELMAAAGLIQGFPDGTFRPEEKVTRQEFETILALARRVEAKNIKQPDKPITRVQILTILSRNGIGLPGFKKLPANEPVSRAELADMMYQTPFGQAAAKRLR